MRAVQRTETCPGIAPAQNVAFLTREPTSEAKSISNEPEKMEAVMEWNWNFNSNKKKKKISFYSVIGPGELS